MILLLLGAWLTVPGLVFAGDTTDKQEIERLREELRKLKKVLIERDMERRVQEAAKAEQAAQAKAARQEIERLREELRNLKKVLIERDVERRVQEAAKAEQAAQAKAAQAEARRVREELQRLQDEVRRLADTFKRREQENAGLKAEVKRYRDRAVTKELEAKSALDRAQQLLAQLQDLQAENARLRAKAGGEGKPPAKGSEARNPPAEFVKGTITKIEPKDKNLVEISLGSDAGLKVGHTLEVYRVTPRPEYLGTLRIVETQKSTSRAVRLRPEATRGPLQVGDQVASKVVNP
jgi:hypothetical protein